MNLYPRHALLRGKQKKITRVFAFSSGGREKTTQYKTSSRGFGPDTPTREICEAINWFNLNASDHLPGKSNLERSDPIIMYYSKVFMQVVSSFLIPFLHLQFERTYVLYVALPFPGSANSDGCCASSKTIQTDDQRHPR